MDREIKFRGKAESWGWVYGCVVFDNSIPQNEALIFTADGVMWSIQKDTVCQFVGWRDKNKVEVYERDLVLVNGTKKVGEYMTEIVWNGTGFCLKENKTYLTDSRAYLAITSVIGNVFDSPI